MLFDHSCRNLHLALLFQGIQFIFLDLTIIRPLHCSSHFFPQIPPQKFQHSSATGLPSLVLLKQSFLIAFKQSSLPLNCVVLSSQCLNFAAWVVTLCLNSSSTILVPLLLHIVFSFQPPTNLGSSNLTSHSAFLIYSYLFSTALSFV